MISFLFSYFSSSFIPFQRSITCANQEQRPRCGRRQEVASTCGFPHQDPYTLWGQGFSATTPGPAENPRRRSRRAGLGREREGQNTCVDSLVSFSFSHRVFEIGLPKALKETLQFLASNEQIDHLTAALQDQLEQANPNSVDRDRSQQQLPWDSDSERPVNIEWSEGVEEFKDLTIDHLYSLLGVPDKNIPLFNLLQDPSGINDPWTKEGKEWLGELRGWGNCSMGNLLLSRGINLLGF